VPTRFFRTPLKSLAGMSRATPATPFRCSIGTSVLNHLNDDSSNLSKSCLSVTHPSEYARQIVGVCPFNWKTCKKE
jgi:hypothetical protein